ncbi:MAG: hypothetical protein WD068_00985 [Candidatus Babeliales bacterium]
MNIQTTLWNIILLSTLSTASLSYAQSCDFDDCENNNLNSCELFCCKPHFAIRSQASNTARTLLGRAKDVHLAGYPDTSYHVANVTIGGSKTFRKDDQIGTYFSPACNNPCSKCGPCVTFGGNNEKVIDIRSADFGTSCTGSLCLCPKVSNIIAELDWFVGLHAFCEGLFFDIHIPVVHSRWSSGADSCTGSCSDFFAPGLMDSSTTQSTPVGTNCIADAVIGNFTWGDVFEPMHFGKISSKTLTKTGLADLQLELGYDYFLAEDYHLGAKLILKIPTGNTPQAVHLFEPIVGNEGHFEFGIGATAHWVLFTRHNDHRLVWYFEGDATHLFSSRKQMRLFDLKHNGCFSRYLLLKAFVNDSVSNLERGPNIFAQQIQTSFGIQVDMTSIWSYQTACWDFELGYNYWARSHENLEKLCCTIPLNTYGIKGIEPMTNNATASLSTIKKSEGTHGTNDGATPIYISCDDLNHCSALVPSAQSYSVVGYIGYTNTNAPSEPYLGIGTQVEFSATGNAAFDQFHLWLKGGWSW